MVRDFLASKFQEDKVIGRGYGTPWPSRSPDLSPLDFYFWGTLKARVFHQFRPSNLNELKDRVMSEMNNFRADELRRAVDNFLKRAELVIQEEGGSIEQLL